MMRHAEFGFGFILAALGIALTGGIGFGAVLAWMIGFGVSMGDWWAGMLQAHGHAQLMGWAGLFIMGMSLHFVPRLSGQPLRFERLRPWILLTFSAGILTRVIVQPILHLSDDMRWGMAISGSLEVIGVSLYLLLILSSVFGAPADRSALKSVRVFFLMAVLGWISYTLTNAFLCFQTLAGNNSLVEIGWNRFGIDLFTGCVLLPIAFAFSVRTFPLYLRLPAPDWPVRRLGFVYLASVFLVQLPAIFRLQDLSFLDAFWISGVGRVMKGGALLYLIWRLNVLLRTHSPWTVKRIGEPSPERKPTRQGLPDYGEFGRFEWLLYGAYGFLALGAVLEILMGSALVGGYSTSVDADAVRHVYLAGFISMLILGMAPRMIPGFLHKRQVAHPGLVGFTFWLAGVAAIFRVMPLLLSDPMSLYPWSASVASGMFGISGVLGWIAVASLAWNLVATMRES